MIMPVYSSGSRRPGRPSRAFRLAYFDARPRAGIQAVYDGRCPRDEAAQELEEAYKSLKAEAGRVVEEQHAVNMNLAVQAAWERAGRLQETAVAAARKEAKEQAEKDADEDLTDEQKQQKEEVEAIEAQ